jgi:hypothetical protein
LWEVKVIRKILFASLLIAAIFVILDGKAFAKFCSACNTTLPNVVTAGGSCQFAKVYTKPDKSEVKVIYKGTYSSTVFFKECGAAGLFSSCTGKTIRKRSTCNGTAVNPPSGVPVTASYGGTYTKDDVCE